MSEDAGGFSVRLKMVLLLGALVPASPAWGVIVAQGTGTQNVTSPGEGSGWDNVGIVNGSSGVYLGDRWVLTASHVGGGPIDFGGTFGSFASVSGSERRLNNADNSFTDLTLFRLQLEPDLPALILADSTPDPGTSVIMIGNGRNRDPSLTQWGVSGATWTENGGTDRSGYKWAAGNTKRWGVNATHDFNGAAEGGALVIANATFGDVVSFATQFSNVLDEGQAASGDSGGAIFDLKGELLGLMHAIGTSTGQPASTAVFGNLTYAADIASYRTAILAVIPEPSSALLLSGAGALLALRRRRNC